MQYQLVAEAMRQQRWRPRWLTSRAVLNGAIFTVAIFALVLAVAAIFAANAGAGSRPTPVHVVTPDQTRVETPQPAEPND